MSKEVLQGTLDLMALRTLESMGPQHGFGLAKRILQVSEGVKSRWGASDNNRKAKFYELTARGRTIAEDTASCQLTVSIMGKFLAKRTGDR